MAEEGHKVSLNVYDLSQGMARQFSMTLLGKAIQGIWHTGVVVYGNEYYFSGGLEHSLAGATPYGTPLRVIDLGATHIPKDVFEMYLQEISPCWVFGSLPMWIKLIIDVSIQQKVPMIERLEQTMKVGAVPQAPQFKEQILFPDKEPTSTKLCPGPPAINKKEDESESKPEGKPSMTSEAQTTTKNNDIPAEVKTAGLGNARVKLQEEITSEFAAIMASETVGASEAAALATRRVMKKYGNTNSTQS